VPEQLKNSVRNACTSLSRRSLTAEARVRFGSVHVGFVVDKVALGQVFLRVLRFSPLSFIPPVLHYTEERKKLIIFITGLHNKPQGCGASVVSAAGLFTTRKMGVSNSVPIPRKYCVSITKISRSVLYESCQTHEYTARAECRDFIRLSGATGCLRECVDLRESKWHEDGEKGILRGFVICAISRASLPWSNWGWDGQVIVACVERWQMQTKY
jgi:hypothetical protein